MMKGTQGQGGITMSIYTPTVLALCFISVLASAYTSKNKGTLMEYMVFIMSFSMTISLSLGFYFGMIFKGNLVSSILLSMLIGGGIGLLIGLRFHLYSALEGLFSGLMAGMMGAMTTEMLNMQQTHTVLLISILLAITFTLFCTIQFLSETFSGYTSRRFFFLLSIGIMILLTVFVTFPNFHPNGSSEHEQHMQHH